MPKLIGMSLGLCIALMTLIWGACLAGQIQPIPNSIAQMHLIDCAPPCWIGITPGLTSVEDAKARLIAIFGGQRDLTIKDAGFADGYVSPIAVENTIEGENFHLFVRLNISELVDGESEIVQSIDLFVSRSDRSNYAPTVGDILGTFGAPQRVFIEDFVSSGYQITLKYAGFDVVYFTQTDRVAFEETPHFYLGNRVIQTLSTEYRPWKGIRTLSLGG